MREKKRGMIGGGGGGMGCGGWGFVNIIKRHHWPPFLKRLTKPKHHHHHHHHPHHLRWLFATEPATEERDNLIVGDVQPMKINSIKSLLADEMLNIKASSSHAPTDLFNEPDEHADVKPNDRALPPKHFFDALDIISANQELLVKSLQDPGSPLAHHFRNEQALCAKRGLVKSETFPLPGSRLKPKFNNAKPPLSEGIPQPPRQTRVVMKRFKDLKHKIKHAVRERKKEMHRVAMDAVIHKIPHGQDVEKEIDNSQLFKNNFQAADVVGGYESDFTTNKPRVRQMKRASSLNDSMDRYCQLYETSVTHRSISDGTKRAKAVPKHMSRIYSLPDMKYYIDQKECFNTKRTLEDQTTTSLDVSTIPEDESHIDATATESSEVASSSTTIDDQEKIQLDSQRNELEAEHQEELIVEQSIVIIEPPENPSLNVEHDMSSNAEEEEEEEEEEEVKEFRYVRDILELSGVSGDGLVPHPKGHEEAKGCLVYDPECCGNNESGGKCDHQLLFDLINEVLMEIYGRSYTYYPSQLSSLSRTAPMPVGQHVVSQVWGLISSYLSIKAQDDQSLSNVVANDLGKSGWWMNLQFDCECVGIELEDLIFDDILEELISIHLTTFIHVIPSRASE